MSHARVAIANGCIDSIQFHWNLQDFHMIMRCKRNLPLVMLMALALLSGLKFHFDQWRIDLRHTKLNIRMVSHTGLAGTGAVWAPDVPSDPDSDGAQTRTPGGEDVRPPGLPDLSDMDPEGQFSMATTEVPPSGSRPHDDDHNNALCPAVPPNLGGKTFVNKTIPHNLDYVASLHPEVGLGGRWRPSDCRARHRVAVVIPYRDRPDNLLLFLQHMHTFLQRQLIEYQIFVAEQVPNTVFNRGMMKNIGFVEAQKLGKFDCAVFHDLDLLPENNQNLYYCSPEPRHLCVAIDSYNYRVLPRKAYFGGAIMVDNKLFTDINGYSNRYIGWGGEDSDLMFRVCNSNASILRYEAAIGRYQECTHKKQTKETSRAYLLNRGFLLRHDIDGLSDLEYRVKHITQNALYTVIHADVMQTKLEPVVKETIVELQKEEYSAAFNRSVSLCQACRTLQSSDRKRLITHHAPAAQQKSY